MKDKRMLLALCIITLSWSACKKECDDCNETPLSDDYKKGVFVVNEGPFGGSGTITWYNTETGEVRDSIFEKANNGASLGQFVQSLTFQNGKGYIVVNGKNQVVVVDGSTFQFQDTIGGLALPRFFQPIDNNTAYVSQWGADGISGSVAKIDLNTNKVIKTYPTGAGPEKMVFIPQTKTLYIANSGGYGVDSTIVWFNVETESPLQKLVIPGQKNPANIIWNSSFSGDQPSYVLCKGDWQDPNSQGWVGLPFDNPTLGFPVPKGSDDLVFNQLGTNAYFTSGTSIYRASPVSIPQLLLLEAAYGFNIHPETGEWYCADAVDFNSRGLVNIYDLNMQRVKAFPVGIAPGEIVFKL